MASTKFRLQVFLDPQVHHVLKMIVAKLGLSLQDYLTQILHNELSRHPEGALLPAPTKGRKPRKPSGRPRIKKAPPA